MYLPHTIIVCIMRQNTGERVGDAVQWLNACPTYNLQPSWIYVWERRMGGFGERLQLGRIDL